MERILIMHISNYYINNNSIWVLIYVPTNNYNNNYYNGRVSYQVNVARSYVSINKLELLSGAQ